MEGMSGAGKKCTPWNTGQVIDIIDCISLIGHVNGRAFVIRGEFTFGRICASLAGRAANGKDHFLAFEGGGHLSR